MAALISSAGVTICYLDDTNKNDLEENHGRIATDMPPNEKVFLRDVLSWLTWMPLHRM